MDAVGICNIALGKIGHTQLIEDLETIETVEAEQCDLHFEARRDELLELHPWKFATKRVVLALLEDVERSDWEYVYTRPANCIAVRHLATPGDRNPAASGKISFDVEANDAGDGEVILTDLEDAELIFTIRHEYPAVWPATFCDALAWRIAVELALSIKKDRAQADAMLKGFQLALATAGAVSSNQSQRDPPPRPPSVLARF